MKTIKLRDLCFPEQIGKYGIPASAEEFSLDKVRYLRISDIDDKGNLLNNDKKSVSSDDLDKYILEEGDIVFARTGNSTGRTYFHENKNGKLAFAGFLIKYGIDPSKINPKFLKYYTVTNEYKQWVNNLSVGSTRGNMNAQTFSDCQIPLIKRTQQNLLVDVLSALDDKIELNNKINAELEALAKTLYDYWFVQFDFPNADGQPYKSSDGEMVYNEQLKREIPEGWEVCTVSELAKTGSGGTPLSTKLEYYNDGKIAWINSGETNNPFIINTKNYITELGLKNSSAKIFPKNTLLMAMYGATAGKVSFLKFEATTNQAICAIIPNNKEHTYLLKYTLESMYQYLINLSSGSARDNLSQDKIKKLQIINPNQIVLTKFHQFVDGLYNKYYINSQQNQELASLRDWLLPMLMNGQVTVKDAFEG